MDWNHDFSISGPKYHPCWEREGYKLGTARALTLLEDIFRISINTLNIYILLNKGFAVVYVKYRTTKQSFWEMSLVINQQISAAFT